MRLPCWPQASLAAGALVAPPAVGLGFGGYGDLAQLRGYGGPPGARRAAPVGSRALAAPAGALGRLPER
eukprot:11174140-Lingulodinium_polyedra.AAC.1